MFCDQHVSHKWHVFVILLFFYVLPRVSYGYIWCGFILSAIWRFSNYFSSSLGVGIFALNRMGVVSIGHICTPLCLYPLTHLYTPIHLYAPIPLYIFIFFLRVALVDTLSSLPNSEGGIIPV